ETDDDLIYFKEFNKTFGEDGNMLVIGYQDSSLFTAAKFGEFQKLAHDLSKIEGVNSVISLPTLQILEKDTVNKKFKLAPLIPDIVKTDADVQKVIEDAKNTRFYEGLLYNDETKATLIAIAMDKNYLNSAKRTEVVDKIMGLSESFAQKTELTSHYAGLPYVRAIMVSKVKAEFNLFLVLAAVVTSLILFVFFRSFHAVLFTFLVIAITVILTMGTIVLFGYKMNLLTGILPALIVVISIPNCIYMFNRYHQEYKKHGNKIKSISRIIQKIGFLTFMTNANTAVGFFVLLFTDVNIIKEFGMVAGIISLATFLITLVVVPSLLFYLPAPNKKQLKHLDLNFLRKINQLLEKLVISHRPAIYFITGVMLVVSFYGIYRIQALSYMVDDLPERSNVKTDLAFLEKHFTGVMPLEVVVDLGKPNAVKNLKNLEKLDEFEAYLKQQEYVSSPISVLNVIKASTQAFYNGNPNEYRLPSKREAPFILSYMGKSADDSGLMKSFVDSTGRYVRFSCKVADIGTHQINELVRDKIESKAKEIFGESGFEAKLTGTTLIFLKGNQYLINDLTGSLIVAFILISLMMAMLFTNIKMIIISLVPNIIPILITAGIMGIFNIPLKPSTALIFSISFGISIDSTIHYLSRYKQEMMNGGGNVFQAVLKSLQEAGVSMIYTSLVLFSGFVIFAWSEFGGTIALGVLTSITLFFAMLTNLIVLPSLLLTFVDKKSTVNEEVEEREELAVEEVDVKEADVKELVVQEEEEAKVVSKLFKVRR
ncbi:MAG TPA: efflux RND transporter permease subunit, partial [Cytophagaceae bacterium]